MGKSLQEELAEMSVEELHALTDQLAGYWWEQDWPKDPASKGYTRLSQTRLGSPTGVPARVEAFHEMQDAVAVSLDLAIQQGHVTIRQWNGLWKQLQVADSTNDVMQIHAQIADARKSASGPPAPPVSGRFLAKGPVRGQAR